MNLKKELKNLGYYLITPIPAKYHFEGVNNRRSAIQLAVLTILAPVAVFGGAALVGKVKDEIEDQREFNAGVREIKKLINS